MPDMPTLTGAATEANGEAERGGETSMDGPTITVDQIVELLNSPRRRHALACMESREAPVMEFSELVRCVAEAEYGDYTEQERKRVQISLHQNHVPRLEKAGAVVHNESEEGERYVGEGPHFDVIVRAQEALNEAAANEDGRGGLLDRLL